MNILRRNILSIPVLALAACLLWTHVDRASARSFKDVPEGHWAAKAVHEVTNAGLLKGKTASSFAGNRPLTRYQGGRHPGQAS